MSEFKNENWQLLIDKQNESSISKRRFCLEHELPYHTFLYHRKRLVNNLVSLVLVLFHMVDGSDADIMVSMDMRRLYRPCVNWILSTIIFRILKLGVKYS